MLSNDDSNFINKINVKADLKMKAQRQSQRHVWLGLGMMGMIGWSIAIPTLIGLAIGIWLDEAYPDSYAWTLNLLFLGMLIGCVIAWRWVAKEYKAMQDEQLEQK